MTNTPGDMTTHQLARYLLAHTPDLLVVINGWGSEEGTDHVVSGAFLCKNNTVALGHGGRQPGPDGKWKPWFMEGKRLGPEKEEDLEDA